jgi:hypothetical protein
MLQDILCVADREGERVVCVGAGLEHPRTPPAHSNVFKKLEET